MKIGAEIDQDKLRKLQAVGPFLLSSGIALTTLGFTLAEIRQAMLALVENDEAWEGLQVAQVRGASAGEEIIQELRNKREALKRMERPQ